MDKKIDFMAIFRKRAEDEARTAFIAQVAKDQKLPLEEAERKVKAFEESEGMDAGAAIVGTLTGGMRDE